MTTANDPMKMMIKKEFDRQAKGKNTITYESFYSEAIVPLGARSFEDQAKEKFKLFKDYLGISGDEITYEAYEKARLAQLTK